MSGYAIIKFCVFFSKSLPPIYLSSYKIHDKTSRNLLKTKRLLIFLLNESKHDLYESNINERNNRNEDCANNTEKQQDWKE